MLERLNLNRFPSQVTFLTTFNCYQSAYLKHHSVENALLIPSKLLVIIINSPYSYQPKRSF